MSYYAIGFGGTGAKCLEALLHLCAAGLMPDNEELFVLFVDQDDDNGNLGSAQELLASYINCRSKKEDVLDFLKTPVVSAKPDNWLPENNRNSTLDSFVSYPNLTDEFRHLFDVLYDEKEKTTPLGKGFRGHPSIGASVFAATADLNNMNPWKEIKTKMLDDVNGLTHSRIMFFGSIFGGTGASGVPTISRVFKNWTKDFPENPFKLGGLLMLPFFTFKPLEGTELHADARDFLLNTQAALQYYHQQDYMEILDKVYILGCNDLRNVGKAEIGSQSQKNPPHWIELIAALAAIDFYGETTFQEERYNLMARAEPGKLNWKDLPYDSTLVRKQLTHLVRFAFAYCSVYLPAIKELRTLNSPYWAPWYVNFFYKKGVDIQSKLENELGDVEDYCQRFLRWFAGIEYSITGNTGTKFLVDYSSFAELSKNEDGKLEIKLKENKYLLSKFSDFKISDEGPPLDLKRLWGQMCESYSDGTEENGSWKFLNELYSQCEK